MPPLFIYSAEDFIFRNYPHCDIFEAGLDLLSDENDPHHLEVLQDNRFTDTAHHIADKVWKIEHFGTIGYQEFRLGLKSLGEGFEPQGVVDLANFITNDCHGYIGQVIKALAVAEFESDQSFLHNGDHGVLQIHSKHNQDDDIFYDSTVRKAFQLPVGKFIEFVKVNLGRDECGLFYPRPPGPPKRFQLVSESIFVKEAMRIQVLQRNRKPVVLLRLPDEKDEEGRCVFGPGGIFIHKTNKYGLHFIPWDTYEGRIDPLEFDFTPPNLSKKEIQVALDRILRSVCRLMGLTQMGLDLRVMEKLEDVFYAYFLAVEDGSVF